MQTLNDSLKELYLQREVTLEEAEKRSGDPNEFRQMVGEPISG
jgi:Tfp pilus assembly pilus retraction ATPase PilT